MAVRIKQLRLRQPSCGIKEALQPKLNYRFSFWRLYSVALEDAPGICSSTDVEVFIIVTSPRNQGTSADCITTQTEVL